VSTSKAQFHAGCSFYSPMRSTKPNVSVKPLFAVADASELSGENVTLCDVFDLCSRTSDWDVGSVKLDRVVYINIAVVGDEEGQVG
jgi:hypothetical protein